MKPKIKGGETWRHLKRNSTYIIIFTNVTLDAVERASEGSSLQIFSDRTGHTYARPIKPTKNPKGMTARLQTSAGPIKTGTKLIIYLANDGTLWARAATEFLDGRFKKDRDNIAKPPKQYWFGIGKLTEESGELGQLLGKALTFPHGPHPDQKGPLASRLPTEISDLYAALDYFVESNPLDKAIIKNRRKSKLTKFRKWGLPGITNPNI
jgi:hypothetical protein